MMKARQMAQAEKQNSPDKRDTYHHNNLADAVIAKAVDLISERDGPAFSLREIATAIGVSHTAVYRHFADKDALLGEVTRMGFAALADYQTRFQAESDPDPMAQLRALGRAYISFAQEQPGYFSLMFHSRPTSATNATVRDTDNSVALETLISTIKACQAKGILIPGDARRMAAYLVLAPHGLSSYYAQKHVPAFIADQADGPQDLDWLAEVAIAPLLCDPIPPHIFARRFFNAP